MVLRCAWGAYIGDARYPWRHEGGRLMRFPTPKRDIDKCVRWVKACGLPHEQLNVSKLINIIASMFSLFKGAQLINHVV